MKRSVAAIVLVTIVSSACSSTEEKLSAVESDPSFTYTAVMRGGMAVGGVTSALGKLSDAERNRMAEMLRPEIRDARPAYTKKWTSKLAEASGFGEILEAQYTPDEYVDAPPLAEVTRDGFARLVQELD